MNLTAVWNFVMIQSQFNNQLKVLTEALTLYPHIQDGNSCKIWRIYLNPLYNAGTDGGGSQQR